MTMWNPPIHWAESKKTRHVHVAFLPGGLNLVVEGWSEEGEQPPEWSWKLFWIDRRPMRSDPDEQKAPSLREARDAALRAAQERVNFDLERPF